ncbi:cytokine-dependent hematopoietic cell linker isoform X2 [Lepisosteus oculatus]|uniref:cytokine-dependent hematopoietic cell linker isoform X2 n=1 Tax=Lepisosteus oculatus TaxID=7918 RepID=UPI0035F5041C
MQRWGQYAKFKRSEDSPVQRATRQVNEEEVELNSRGLQSRFSPQVYFQSEEYFSTDELTIVNSHELPTKMDHVVRRNVTERSWFSDGDDDSEPSKEDNRYDRSCPPHFSSPGLGKFQNIPPNLPERNLPGPAVNRDLKPNRNSLLPTRERLIRTDFQNLQHPPRPPKPIPKELLPLPPIPGISKTEKETHIPLKPLTGRKGIENCLSSSVSQHHGSPHPAPRCLQDLEFRDTSNSRLSYNQGPHSAVMPSQMPKYNHEWPPVKKDMKKRRPTWEDHGLETPRDLARKTSPNLNDYKWYIGACDRYEAENALYATQMDGAFLVRDCSKNITDEPYVLVVFYRNKVYNIKIRYIRDKQRYALGTGLWRNDVFDSVSAIIKFHLTFPIVLIDGKDKTGCQKEMCTLTYPLTKEDVN